jgi:hypothetical protein
MTLVPRVLTDLMIRANDSIGSAALHPDALDKAAAGFGGHGPDQAQAVILRLIALDKIEKERRAGGWSLDIRGKNYALTDRALLEAAAQAPLRMPKSLLMKDLAFQQSELLVIALAATPPL